MLAMSARRREAPPPTGRLETALRVGANARRTAIGADGDRDRDFQQEIMNLLVTYIKENWEDLQSCSEQAPSGDSPASESADSDENS